MRSAACFPSCTPEDPDAECEKYERKIQMLGGIGLQELGIGSDAHIGFCLPGTPFGKGMHVTRVSDKIVEDIRTDAAARRWIPASRPLLWS